jgi:cyclophilin family peptidyl-prolyl cis-trans isomerase
LYGEQARFFEDEIRPHLRHKKKGIVGMAGGGQNMNASQFYITTAAELDSLDDKHTIFGEVPHPSAPHPNSPHTTIFPNAVGYMTFKRKVAVSNTDSTCPVIAAQAAWGGVLGLAMKLGRKAKILWLQMKLGRRSGKCTQMKTRPSSPNLRRVSPTCQSDDVSVRRVSATCQSEHSKILAAN